MLQCVTVCHSVSQCVTVCHSVSKCIAVCCSVSQCVAVCRSMSHCVTVCQSVFADTRRLTAQMRNTKSSNSKKTTPCASCTSSCSSSKMKCMRARWNTPTPWKVPVQSTNARNSTTQTPYWQTSRKAWTRRLQNAVMLSACSSAPTAPRFINFSRRCSPRRRCLCACVRVCVNVCVRVSIHVYICTSAEVCVCKCKCVYVCVCKYVCTCEYIYVFMHT